MVRELVMLHALTLRLVTDGNQRPAHGVDSILLFEGLDLLEHVSLEFLQNRCRHLFKMTP
jgi:hypothetical protein